MFRWPETDMSLKMHNQKHRVALSVKLRHTTANVESPAVTAPDVA